MAPVETGAIFCSQAVQTAGLAEQNRTTDLSAANLNGPQAPTISRMHPPLHNVATAIVIVGVVVGVIRIVVVAIVRPVEEAIAGKEAPTMVKAAAMIEAAAVIKPAANLVSGKPVALDRAARKASVGRRMGKAVGRSAGKTSPAEATAAV